MIAHVVLCVVYDGVFLCVRIMYDVYLCVDSTVLYVFELMATRFSVSS